MTMERMNLLFQVNETGAMSFDNRKSMRWPAYLFLRWRCSAERIDDDNVYSGRRLYATRAR